MVERMTYKKRISRALRIPLKQAYQPNQGQKVQTRDLGRNFAPRVKLEGERREVFQVAILSDVLEMICAITIGHFQ